MDKVGENELFGFQIRQHEVIGFYPRVTIFTLKKCIKTIKTLVYFLRLLEPPLLGVGLEAGVRPTSSCSITKKNLLLTLGMFGFRGVTYLGTRLEAVLNIPTSGYSLILLAFDI